MGSENTSILLIEDNPDDVVLLQEVLSQTSENLPVFTFKYAQSLTQGIEIVANERIGLILLDLSLPDCRGIQTLIELQSKVPHIPVVILTAMNDLGIEAVRKGAQDYLVKGRFDNFTFTRTIQHAVERHKIKMEHEVMEIQLRRANDQLERLALLDPLTGILNRRGLQDALSREVCRIGCGHGLMALIMDLDNFKQINDVLGHAVGDIVLREIAGKVAASVRVTDYVCRVGGDEFLVLMPQTRYAEGASVAQKIRRTISGSPVSTSLESTFRITASLGLISVNEEIVSVDELLARLHAILHRSKCQGKDTVSYDEVDKVSLEGRIDEIGDIIGALKKPDQFHVVRQPIFDLGQRLQVGYEFLSRFNIAGLEAPDDFFRVCFENNILTHVDRHCFNNCVTASKDLPREIKRHLNIFPSTMIDIPVRNLMQIFEESASKGSYCIEISEQQIIGDPSYLVEPVMQLKKSGIEIAIDDVGFGRSCLESLIMLEPDVVKIDKKLVNGISKNSWCERSLNRFLKVTEALGSEVIAEGIETLEDMQTLVSLGVKYGQGYYLGRPA